MACVLAYLAQSLRASVKSEMSFRGLPQRPILVLTSLCTVLATRTNLAVGVTRRTAESLVRGRA